MGTACRRVVGAPALGWLPVAWVSLAACAESTPSEGRAKVLEAEVSDTGQDSHQDSDECAEHRCEVDIVIWAEVDIAEVMAFRTAESGGGSELISLNVPAGAMTYGFVEPGTWWCQAWSTDWHTCNVTAAATLVGGDRFDWEVDSFPGELDESRTCIVP